MGGELRPFLTLVAQIPKSSKPQLFKSLTLVALAGRQILKMLNFSAFEGLMLWWLSQK
jgi:hypothetical protein